MRLLLLALPAFSFALGCSTSNPAQGPADSGSVADATSPTDAPADVTTDGPPACGSPPYVNVEIVVNGASLSGNVPLAGAQFTSTLCPGGSTTSDANGKIAGLVSKGVAFYGRFVAANYINTLTPEQSYQVDTSGVSAVMLPSIFSSILPSFGPDKTTIFIAAMPPASTADAGTDAATGPCDTVDGIQFQVTGHPEAVVTYYSAGAVPQPTTGTSTTASGRASIGGLAAGTPVPLTATKSGCTVTFVKDANTGRAPLENGYLTLIAAYIGP